MESLNYISGATVSATDVRKSWTKIVSGVKSSHRPVFVFTNNTPEVVVLSYQDFQAMQAELEQARREALGKQMIADLIEIAQIDKQPITQMTVAENGVFYPANGD